PARLAEEEEHQDHREPHQEHDLVDRERRALEEDGLPAGEPADRLELEREHTHGRASGLRPGKASDADTCRGSHASRPTCVITSVSPSGSMFTHPWWRATVRSTSTSPIRSTNAPRAAAISSVTEMRAAHDSSAAASAKLRSTTQTP